MEIVKRSTIALFVSILPHIFKFLRKISTCLLISLKHNSFMVDMNIYFLLDLYFYDRNNRFCCLEVQYICSFLLVDFTIQKV